MTFSPMNHHRRYLLVPTLAAYLLAIPAFAQGSPPDSSKAGADDVLAFDLESLLNSKITSASKFSEKLSDAPGMVWVVTRDELQRFGGLTLSEILSRVPGLALSTASFMDRSMIAARGDQTQVDGSHILFLINGRATREILQGGVISDLLESFPVNILERIEVIEGPGSVLYGSNAFSAVINLITRQAKDNEIVLSGSGAGGGAATSGQVLFTKGALNIVGAGQFHQFPERATPVWTLFTGPASYSIPDRSKGAYVGVNYKGLSFMSSYTEWQTAYNTWVAIGQGRWRRGFADLGYHLKPADNWDMNWNLTFTRATLNAEASIPFVNRVSNELVLEWSNVVTLTPKDQLTFGTLFTEIQGVETSVATSPAVAVASGSRPGEGLYAQLDHELLSSVKLIGGFQANKIGSLNLDVVPRAGLVWNPNSQFSLKALYSSAFRAPSLDETLVYYVTPSPACVTVSGNRNLKPEKVATFDLGVRYQGSRFQAGAGYFRSRLSDAIVMAVSTTGGDSRYQNLGNATFHGFQADGKYYLGRNWFATGSAIYQTNRDGTGNRNITPIANFGAKAGLSYETKNSLTAGLFDVHQGSLPGYSMTFNPRPGAYDLLSANLRYNLSRYLPANAKSSIAVVAHANNLLNKEVWLPNWNLLPPDSTLFNRGRVMYFGLEVTFKPE